MMEYRTCSGSRGECCCVKTVSHTRLPLSPSSTICDTGKRWAINTRLVALAGSWLRTEELKSLPACLPHCSDIAVTITFTLLHYCMLILSLFTVPTGVVAKYCDEYECVSVYLFVHEDILGTTCTIFTDFCGCCLWPWLGPFLASLRYVMYFRFCG